MSSLPDGKVQVIGGDHERTMEMFNPEREYFTAYAHILNYSAPLSTILRAQTRVALLHRLDSRDPEIATYKYEK